MHIPHRLWRRQRRVAVAFVAVAAAVVAPTVTVPATPAPAQPQLTCVDVAFSASTWATGPETGGFAAAIRLTNDCAAPINGWTLGFHLATGHSLSHGWSADWTSAGSQITASSLAWNSEIHPGGFITIGFIGSYSGTYQDPLSCTINGVDCHGGSEPGENQPPQITLTSPVNGGAFTHPCSARLTAQATDPDGAIDRVEFYLNGTLVGTVTSPPYAVEVPIGHPAIQSPNVAMARAYDDGSPALSTDSATAAFGWVIPPPAPVLIVCGGPVTVVEGGSTVVNLRSTCGGDVQVTIEVSGDPAVTAAPESFLLTSAGHDVTVSAAPGSAGATATLRATASCLPATVPVTVVSAG